MCQSASPAYGGGEASQSLMHSMHEYQVRPRKDHRGFDLICDPLPFGRLVNGERDDVIIKGGTVYDGTGAEPKHVNVAIRGDRIAGGCRRFQNREGENSY
jgi:hypothetical protein